MKTTTLISALFALGFAASASAQQMNFQGRLTDNVGAPRPGPQATLTFSIWNAATGGGKEWGDFQINADLIDGRFSVKLGDATGNDGNGNLLSDSFGGARYIQVQVGGDAPLPRQEVLSSPKALFATEANHALEADHALDADTADFATLAGGISSSNLKLSITNVGSFGASTTFNPDGTNQGILLESFAGGEASGLFLNGNTAVLYNPGDSDLFKIYDEDNFANGPEFTVLAGGGFAATGGSAVTGTLSVSSTLDVNGSLDVDGFTQIDGFTSNGTGNVNGRFNMNTTSIANVTTMIRESPDDATDAFSFPLLIEDSTGVNLMGFQIARPGTTGLFIYQGTAVKPGGGSFAVLSDRRLKKNITPLTESLSRLTSLKPSTFEYKKDAPNGCPSGIQTGFIAQEVKKVFPEWIGTIDGETLLLDIKGFEAVATAAIIELRAEKDTQLAALEASTSESMTALQKENAALKTRLAELEQQFGTLIQTVETLKAPAEDVKEVSLVK